MAARRDMTPRRGRAARSVRLEAGRECIDAGARQARAESKADTGAIRFLLDGEVVTVDCGRAHASVLQFSCANICGVPERRKGCAEGDCGACTVVVGEIAGDGVALKTVNACIQFVPALDGKALFTVEDLRQAATETSTPYSRRWSTATARNAGFCTPGFVMSLWALYVEHDAAATRPTGAAIRSALTGNLCRCTGYRPILDAGERMFDLPRVPFDRAALHRKLRSLARDGALAYEHAGRRFFAPRTVAELALLKARPSAGDAACRRHRRRPLGDETAPGPADIIYVGNVDELKVVREGDGVLRIGAAATLTDAYGALVRHYPELAEMFERFASPPIRNAGTMGGNVANGFADRRLDAGIDRARCDGDTHQSRTLADAAAGRPLYRLHEEGDGGGRVCRGDSRCRCRHRRCVSGRTRCRNASTRTSLPYARPLRSSSTAAGSSAPVWPTGGVAATPKRASATERALAGAEWNEATARAAMAAIAADYTPLTDMRASADYRRRTAQNLLYRFFLETRPDRAAAGRRGQRVRSGVASRGKSPMNRQAEGFMARNEALPRRVLRTRTNPRICTSRARRRMSTTSRRSPARSTRRSACRKRRTPASGRSTSPRCARRRRWSRSSRQTTFRGPTTAARSSTTTRSWPTGWCSTSASRCSSSSRQRTRPARRAARLAKVDYEVLAPVLTPQEAKRLQSYVLPPMHLKRGDPDRALAGAPRRMQGEFYVGGQRTVLPRGTDLLRGAERGRLPPPLLLDTASDRDAARRRARAQSRRDQVTVEMRRMGGGFGGKESQSALFACVAAVAAHRLRVPVKIRLDRDDDFLATGKRHCFHYDYHGGYGDDGVIRGAKIEMTARAGFSADLSGPVCTRAVCHFDNTYYLGDVDILALAGKTNTQSNTAFRGFGGPQGAIAIEYLIDNIARDLGRDPWMCARPTSTARASATSRPTA
jgi:xanthine dehydrogenase small subunit